MLLVKLTGPFTTMASLKLRAEIKQLSEELEKSNFNLSNPSELIEKEVVFVSELADCWMNGDYQERQMVQSILFPEGIFYDKENDAYRTSGINEVIGLIAKLSGDYQQNKRRQVYHDDELSPSVARGGVEPPTFGL